MCFNAVAFCCLGTFCGTVWLTTRGTPLQPQRHSCLWASWNSQWLAPLPAPHCHSKGSSSLSSQPYVHNHYSTVSKYWPQTIPLYSVQPRQAENLATHDRETSNFSKVFFFPEKSLLLLWDELQWITIVIDIVNEEFDEISVLKWILDELFPAASKRSCIRSWFSEIGYTLLRWFRGTM